MQTQPPSIFFPQIRFVLLVLSSIRHSTYIGYIGNGLFGLSKLVFPMRRPCIIETVLEMIPFHLTTSFVLSETLETVILIYGVVVQLFLFTHSS